MKIVSAAEMREIDRLTSERHKIPSLTLMENAGSAVARFLLQRYPKAREVIVLCGKGNNGGDGFVAARKLHEAGRQVKVLILGAAEEAKGDAGEMLKVMPLLPTSVRSPEKFSSVCPLLESADLILDAVFGTGFRPPLPELAANAFAYIRRLHVPVVSVDIPSGADSDSFNLDQPGACRSSAIVTFTAPKPGIIFSALTRGPIVVAGIGSPEDVIDSKLRLEWNCPRSILLKERPLNSNKGLYGHALIIGGSLGKSGAPTMASAAALRIGAGLATCAVPRGIQMVVAGAIPELMTEPLDENGAGAISERALDKAETALLLERKNVVVIGPGLGRNEDTVRAVRDFVPRCPLPLVLDADALNAFEKESRLLDGSQRPLVLTPHPGEMARLIGSTVKDVEANRVELARRFAREHHLVLVLKGWRTLIADDRDHIWVNTTGNPGLAKGGSGDALTGMIAGLMAQRPDCIVDAVRAAVYLHGLAADAALSIQTEETMLTSDVIAALPSAFRIARKPADEFTWIQRAEPRA
jgi:ADP-dependent NAD(P)H-hydrate dehydratase / NAD(P)H-hydrate epimerase